jgi:hypothetical protein
LDIEIRRIDLPHKPLLASISLSEASETCAVEFSEGADAQALFSVAEILARSVVDAVNADHAEREAALAAYGGKVVSLDSRRRPTPLYFPPDPTAN